MTAARRPAAAAGQRHPARMTSRTDDARPYPRPAAGADDDVLQLSVARALLRAGSAGEVRQVLATAVGDLGGALVPARLNPTDALPLDVSLGVGEPVLVVRDPVSVAGAQLPRLLPGLVEDARAALSHLHLTPTRDDGRGDSLEAFLDALAHADVEAALRSVHSRLRQGQTPRTVVRDLLAPAMRRVGELWLSGEWSVADEHAATAVVARCVAQLPHPSGLRHVVLASPEGEWHSLPAQLFAATVEDARVTVLGPAVPPPDLQRYLSSFEPDVLVLSVTLPTSLMAAAGMIAAAHEAGVPVVCGGSAFGPDDRRAARLGADAWSSDELPVHVALSGRPVELPAEAVRVDQVSEEVLRQALAGCLAEPWASDVSTDRLQRGLDDLRWLARYTAAALAVDDPTVLTDLVAWTCELAAARDVREQVLPDAMCHLANALEPEAPACAALLRRCLPTPDQTSSERLRRR